MSTSFKAPDLSRFRQRALVVGIIFLVIFAIGAFFDRDQFFHSYIFGFTFWTGISVGSLALLMLQHLTGGGWGLVIRRVLEAATRTLPLIVLLFIPIVLGAHHIYPWTHEEELAQHPVVKGKSSYLNLTFFSLRAAVYFAIWLTLAFFLNKWSLEQDRTADPRSTKSMRLLSGPGMVLFVFTVTFASIDCWRS